MKRILLLISFSSPLFLHAQGFQVNLQGQKQQAMGGAGTGTALDAASVFFNPGAVSLLKENSVSAGATLTFDNTVFRDGNSQKEYVTVSPASSPFTAYAVWGPVEKKWKVGLGIYTPFGSVIKYEDAWSGRFAITQMKLLSIFFQPTVSYQFSEKLGIGAGFVYGYGNIDLQRDLPVTDYNSKYGSAQLTGTASGLGYNVGIYYKPADVLSLGVTYRSEVKMKVDNGNASFHVPSSLSSNFPSGKFSASLPLPQVLSLGIGHYPSDKWTVAADFNYIMWSSYQTLSFDYEQNTSSLKDTESPRNYKNSFALRLGAEYKANEKWKLRAGGNYQKTPIQDGYVTPEVPDADRWNWTVGVGFAPIEKLVIDASFTYVNFVKRTDTNIETQLSGTYKSRILAPGLSLTYIF